MSQTVFVGGDLKILKIFPSEADLCDIKTNIPCPISNCSRIFKSSSNLTMHLEKYHRLIEPNQSSLEKKRENIIYQYYCPVKCCQYHNNIKPNKKKIFFDQLKYLKQHFLKVHSEKRFTCNLCDKSFSIESALKRHLGECGLEFKCSCGQSYMSRHNLLLHATRKNHTIDEKYNKRLKMAKAPYVCILPKPTSPAHDPSRFSISSQFAPGLDAVFKERDNLQLLTGLSKKKHIPAAPRAKNDLSLLVKRKIVLKKLMKVKETSSKPFDFSTIFRNENNLSEIFKVENSTLLESDASVGGFGPDLNFNITSDPEKTFDTTLSSSERSTLIANEPTIPCSPEWSGSDEKLKISDPLLVFSRTDINLNELNSFSSKSDCSPRNVFEGCELSTSPKLSQSTQTKEPFTSNFAFTQTGCDVTFDDGGSCNYYDSFEFSNSPKLSQSTQTFHSSSQLSQTDIQSSFFDDSSNNLSDLISYYDNFETSNSPKLSQSTQTMGHSLCSWSDNVTQTDQEDQLFGDSSIAPLDECYRTHFNSINETSGCNKLKEEDVSTQTTQSLPSRNDKPDQSLLDELTTSETQTDPFENPYNVIPLSPESYYDNFETLNSPKLSQSTQTMGHSLCSWSDNVTQTELEGQLFGDSSIVPLDDCYRIHYNSMNETSSCNKLKEEDVSTQTTLSSPFQDNRQNKSLLDELTTSETQTDPFENHYHRIALSSQSFSNTQTQTSTSFNYLIDSETQTQKLLNQLIDIETQTHVSNFCQN